jgi:4-methylaminobutanoate oxidase (formaldehyde-forming)
MAERLPDQARVVIIGGGIVGCSIAYHLTKLGWDDVVLLERKQLTCGTTWHAAGLVGQLRATANLTRLAQYTTDLYAGLEAETGQATGFKQNGSISLATCEERFEELKRGASMARTFGLEVDVISSGDIKEMHPLLNVESVVGGVFLPKDGQTNPIDTSIALSKGARMGGAKVLENVKVTGIRQDNGRVTGVSTDQGDITAEYVVLAAGMWSRELGRAAGVNVPLHACEHFYILTDPVPGLPSDIPVLRDPDGCAYYKEDAGKLLLGAFEPNAKPWGSDGIPEDFCFDELPEDVEHFMPILERAIGMVPALESVGIRKFFNGPESFTPDVRYMLGETPELRHLFVATGFNSIGIQSAGGAGKVLAEWIVEGHPTMDVADVDVRRMMPFQNNLAYIRERVSESLGLLYAMHWPYYQNETARGLRRSPFHHRLAERGACFGEVAGWERPNWFAPEGTEPKYEYSYKRQNWFPYAAEEHKAVREGVALFDQTSFAEFLVQGRDAETVLQRVCANDVAVPDGRVVYTQWLNARGGIEADLTVTRLAEDAYMVITAGANATRDFCWLKRSIDADEHCITTDVSSGYATLGLMGPKSRELLTTLTRADLSNDGFPFGTSQEIEIGHVFEQVMEAGEAFGLKPAGMHVMDACRLEKAFRHWGHDITDEDTPIQAGLGFACAFEKNIPFIGRDALLRQKEAGVSRRIAQFVLDDPEPLVYHNEPIWRDGEIVGYLSSGNYGHHLGRAVGLGYVNAPAGQAITADWIKEGRYEIEVACERFPAQVSLRPLYDPKAERVKT